MPPSHEPFHRAGANEMAERLVFKGYFRASDASGTSHFIDVFQLMQVSPRDSIIGLPLFRTTDGQPVNRTKKGEYEIVGTGTALHSLDPNCP
jgi:hypothetical protein